MGWKNVKDYFRIEHIVCVEKGIIKIGSPYIRDLIQIDPSGDVFWGFNCDSDELKRYFRELSADKQKLLKLMNTEDVFEKSIPVFYYDGESIFEDFCEDFGWPNVTHSGKLMYEGTYSEDRNVLVEKAKEDLASSIRYLEGKLVNLEKDIVFVRNEIETRRKKLEKWDNG